MSLINTQIKPFKNTAYQTGKFLEVSNESVLGKWSVFVFYPADFTYVCPTELEDLADNYEEFKKLGVEVYGVSTDTHFAHKAWQDISPAIKKVKYPLVGDPAAVLAKNFDVLIYDGEDAGLALRGTFLVNPEGEIKLCEIHDNGIGRDAKELLRKVKAAQYVASHPGEVCPAKWTEGAKTLKPGLDLVGKIYPMLDTDLKTQLEATLALLKRPVVLTAALDDSPASVELRALLSDVLEASELVRLEELVTEPATALRRPSFSVHAEGEEPRLRFAGLPLGHEFTSLVLALLHVGGHAPKISAEALRQLEELEGPLHFETYFSQSCQNCPDVVQALNLMAARNRGVTHTAIDGALFQAEVDERQVMAVPTVYLNGERFGQGRMELEELLAKLDKADDRRRAAKLDAKEPFDMLIVGGGPAGAAAAIYAARKGLRTGIVAERFGGQVMDTLAIENFISVPETEGPRFAAALEQHVRAYPVDIIKHERVKKLVPGALQALQLNSGATLSARSVIVATGARWRDMNVPGEAEYRTRGVTYCPHCDGPLFKGKRVAVVGGGNSGAEAAIDLAGVVLHVTLLEFMDQLKADDILQRKLKSLPNVEIITSAKTTEVVGDGKKVTGLRYEDRRTSELRELPLEGIFVQIGLLPNTDFLRGTVELNKFGEVVVDHHGRTNVPGVFAAGDVTTVPFKQIIIATGDGAKAALGAFDYLIRSSAPAA